MEDKTTILRRPRKKWALLLVLLIVIVATIIAARTVFRPDSTVEENTAVNNTFSDHSPGSEVLLFIQGRSSVMVASDEQALDELIGALASRDEQVQNLIDSGRVYNVPVNTRVRVIEANFAKLKVRFLDGKRVMTEAWVPERWVR